MRGSSETLGRATRRNCYLLNRSPSGANGLKPFPQMAKETALTKAELTELAADGGTPAQPKMLSEIKARLMGLYLIERREWPNGPLWRTPKGDRRTRARK